MSKLMYVNKTQFAQLQGVLTEIFKKEFSECSAEDQKKILRAVNAKSIKDLLPKQPRVFCPYVKKAEKMRVLPYINLGTSTLDLCCSESTYYVPGYPIPGNLQVFGIQVDTPYFSNKNINDYQAERLLVNVMNAVKRELDK